ncbi:MAG: MerR family transcriptional regulator [Polyangiaceae bacterium]
MADRETSQGRGKAPAEDDESDLVTDGAAAYRIATVAERTGVPEPTLRAWERRYGIPSPPRSSSGYRRYGEADIALVLEMRRLCESGMAASDAARVLSARRETTGAEASAEDPGFDPYAASVRAIVAAVERFDDAGLDLELRRLLMLGPGSEAFERVVRPVLTIIGDKWHAGELSVAQEHFASQRIDTLLRDLLQLAPGASSSSRVILASFADDEHELGLLGAALHLAEWGLRPVLLGARTPPAAIRGAVEALAPALVALSVTVPPTRVRARELVDEYRAAAGEVPIIVGGPGVEPIADLVTKLGLHVAPDEPSRLRALVRRLVRHEGGGEGSKRSPNRKPSRRSR